MGEVGSRGQISIRGGPHEGCNKLYRRLAWRPEVGLGSRLELGSKLGLGATIRLGSRLGLGVLALASASPLISASF